MKNIIDISIKFNYNTVKISIKLNFTNKGGVMKLKQLRTKQGFEKQLDFADALNVKQSTLSMWETGNSKPDIDMVKKIATVLNVSVAEVLECF